MGQAGQGSARRGWAEGPVTSWLPGTKFLSLGRQTRQQSLTCSTATEPHNMADLVPPGVWASGFALSKPTDLQAGDNHFRARKQELGQSKLPRAGRIQGLGEGAVMDALRARSSPPFCHTSSLHWQEGGPASGCPSLSAVGPLASSEAL